MDIQDVKYFQIAKKIWKSVNHSAIFLSEETALQNQINRYKSLFNIFHAGKFYYLIFDLFHGVLIDIDPDIETILGYDIDTVDIHLLLRIMHPDDKSYFLFFEKYSSSFFDNLKVSEYPYYKVQYDIRLKAQSGAYHRILFQYIVINYDADNIYHTFHLHTDISHIKTEGIPSFSIIGIGGRPSYHNIQPSALQKPFDLFTRREREILKEVVRGNSSKKIAAILHLSVHTVNAHKRNIMSKAQVKTATELVRKSIKENWV